MEHSKILLGSNLRYFREKMKLTQKELAQMIGFTEKSISKWETSKSLPTIETIIDLSSIFKVSLDEMMYGANSKCYYLGIDGGGTKTVFALADENGIIIRRVCRESTNPNDIGMKRAQEILKEGINETCFGYPHKKISMFAGISGGTGSNNLHELKSFFSEFGFKSFKNGSDIDNVAALIKGRNKIIVIMGTGFVLYAVKSDVSKRIGGWGYLFEDGGSGYSLGRDAVSAALRDFDGSGKRTVISDILREKIGEGANMHLSRFYEGGKRYIAGFSDVIFEAMKVGDTVAENIFEKNMKCAAEAINNASKEFMPEDEISVIFAGGITAKTDIIFPVIEKYLNRKGLVLKTLQDEPVYGALKIAGMESGELC